MSSITFNKEYDLGLWKAGHTDTLQEVSLNVLAKTELNFYPVDPFSGEIDVQKQLVCCATDEAIYDYILKTKSGPSICAFFIPPRTHTVKDIALDFFIPMTRRIIDTIKCPNLGKISLVVIVFSIDMFTLIIRVFTIIPRVIYNSQKEPHPAKVYFPSETQSLFVECKKTWQINEDKQDGFKSETFTAVFHWRVDFYSPLQSTFEWHGTTYPLDLSITGRVILEEERKGRSNFCNNTLIFGVAIKDYFQEHEKNKFYLSHNVEYFCSPPN